MSKFNFGQYPSFGHQDLEILDKTTVFQGFFRLERYTLRHKLFNGSWSGPIVREIFERGHGALEVAQAITCHVMRQEQADKSAVQARGQGVKQFEALCIVQRDHRVQAFADPRHPLHHRQLGQPGLGMPEKALGVERRVHRRHFAGDVVQAFEVEDILEGRGALVGHRLFQG